MRNLFRKTLELLDGTPVVYGSHSSGQSVVELALVTPILIVLIMGLVEIGWFANNYLILLETSRVGARFGTIQTGDTSPLEWDNAASLSPFAFPGNPDAAVANRFRDCIEIRRDGNEDLQGFYNLLSCIMIQSMSPLEFRAFGSDANGVDDIVISAFSLHVIDPTKPNFTAAMRNALATSLLPTIPSNQSQVLVVGRYPTNANECTVDLDGSFREWERDPFDYIKNGGRDNDYFLKDITRADTPENRLYFELPGYDVSTAGNTATYERQRGFSFSGQHSIAGTNGLCIGSEWTSRAVEQLMNLPAFSLNSSQRPRLPNQGIVLVELFWRHELLLRNPVFNPVFTILGPDTTVAVWAAFPVPAVEQPIQFEVIND